MKKNIIWMALALITLVFASCSNEDETFEGSAPNKKGQITFALSTTKGATTYAIANGDESKLDVATMQIIMVDDATAKVEQVYSGSEIVAGTSGSNKSATIAIPDGTVGNKTFYFVGNRETVAGMSVTVGTTLAELQAMATDKLVAPANLSATNGLLLTGKVAVTDIANATSGQVGLKRRVARFDVNNVATATNVSIKTIKISDARLSAYVFSGNTPDIHTAYPLANLTDIDYSALANANAGVDESVFYLYPGKVGEAGHSFIQIVADVQGTEKIFNVKATTIEANKRYILNVKDANSLEFELVVEEWDEGGDVEANLSNTLIAGSYTKASGNGSFDGARWFGIKNNNSANEFKFTVYAQSKAGVSAEVHNLVGTFASNITVVTGSVGPLTYAGIKGYPVEVTVTVAGYSATEEMASRVIITDLSGSKATAETRVYFNDASSKFYPGTDIKPVKITDQLTTIWAPVNVGASTYDATVLNTTSCGYMFQFGRNISFDMYSNEIVKGPIDNANPTTAYIATSTKDWLTEGDANKDNRDALWTKSINDSPCPQGWRLPTKNELVELDKVYVDKGRIGYDADKHRFAVDGSDGQKLYIVAAGCLNRAGANTNFGTTAYYWSGETKTNGTGAYKMFMGQSTTNIVLGDSELFFAPGYSVRCVKDI